MGKRKNNYGVGNDNNPIYSLLAAGNCALVMIDFQEVFIAMPAIQAIGEGYEVYIIADACGGTTAMAHDMARERMIQAGAVPITWLSFLLELQRDWARLETYEAVTSLAMEDAGTYGMGIEYAKAMLGENYTKTIAAEEEIRKEGGKII
jgi:nicotinamidase-related amidase